MPTPSLLMIPSVFKSGVLASVLPSDGTGDFTVSRPSIATRINSEGVRETVAANIARIDYSNVGCPVLLTEPQSTNYYLNMQSMVTQTTTTVADTYTVSFEGTGTIALSGTFTGSLVGTGVNDLVELTFTATDGALLSTVTGTVNEAQVEKLPYATSRIRTEGTVVTRLADVILGGGDVSTIGQNEGTIIVEGDFTTNSSILGINKDFSNMLQLGLTSSNKIKFLIYNSGVNTVLTSSFLVDNYNKIAVTYKNGNSLMYINGSIAASSADAISFSGSLLDIELNQGFFFSKGKSKIKNQQTFITALTPQELQTLTTV
jgi:hypothetical protein